MIFFSNLFNNVEKKYSKLYQSQYFLFIHYIHQLAHLKNTAPATEPAPSGQMTVAAWSMRFAKKHATRQVQCPASSMIIAKHFPEKMAKLFPLLYKTIFDTFQNTSEN